MTLFFESKRNHKVQDITTLVTSAKWKTARVGSPASLELSLLKSPAFSPALGDRITLQENGTGYFYGYVFCIDRDEKEEISLTAYDQMRYLKNKQTYVFQNKRADEIAAQIFADFQLDFHALANTGYVIPSLVEDSSTLLDIILKALDLTLIHTGQMYQLWDDFGTLRITDVKEGQIPLLLGDKSLVTSFSYKEDIDGDTADFIYLYQENKADGKRLPVVAQDEANMQQWGVLQYAEKVDENLTPAEVREKANSLLRLKNRPERSFAVEAIADRSVRAGRIAAVRIERLGIAGYFIVEECTQDLLKETMRLRLAVWEED